MATKTQQGGVKILWERATIDFGSTAANDVTDSSSITVTGARPGDAVIVGSSLTLPAKGCFVGFVDTTDSVKVRFVNNDDAAVDPDSAVFTVGVVKLSEQ